MSYRVRSIELTIQGEGFHAGRPAVFIRFAGCNLWSGLAEDRGKGGSCSAWCDTDFVTDGRHAGRFVASLLALRCADVWKGPRADRFVVLTGGEPALQVDYALVAALHRFGFHVAMETNGTRPLDSGIDWITLSPKAGVPLAIVRADELKIVHPQPGLDPAEFAGFPASHRFLQPMDGPDLAKNSTLTVAYCLAHPEWRVSVQTHKILGVA